MWSRSQVKERGKATFKANYWKVVLVSMLFLILGGGGSYSANNINNHQDNGAYSVDGDSLDFSVGGYDYGIIEQDDIDELDGVVAMMNQMAPITWAVWAIGLLIFVLIVLALAIVIDVFVYNPLELGIKRFSLVNLNSPAMVREIGFGFDNCYKNVINILFFKDLYTVLWTFLFIIPGIVKSYEYRMIPYLLAENPAMTKEQAFAESKRLMDGNKWNAFVYDLSFIGWYFVSLITVGIAYIFYVGPYKFMADASLYDSIRLSKTVYNNPEFYNAGPNNMGV